MTDNLPHSYFIDKAIKYRTFEEPDPLARQISLSLHPEKTIAVKTFRAFNSENFDRLIYYVSNYVWSPIIYDFGCRRESNYGHAWYVGIDVDTGTTVKEARDILLDLHATFIIGTTMSHQISKNGEPPRDRFRIIVEMDRPCLNPDMFRENVMSWIKIFGGDPVAKDAARLFRPCKVIYSKQDLAQPWIPLPPNYYERKKKQHETQSESIRYHLARRSIPDWILRAQKFGVPKGGGAVKGRHHACFKIGATMTELGYSVDEIVGFLLAGLINKEGDVNVRRQVECGANAALSRIVSPKQQLHEDDFELLHGGQPQREGN